MANPETVNEQEPEVNKPLADLGKKILLAQLIHEQSYIPGNPEVGFASFGRYAKDHMQSALEACDGNEFEARLIWLLNVGDYCEVQEWAYHAQGLNYVFNDKGDYTAPDGKCYHADGTEIVHDPVEAVENGKDKS